MQATKALLRSMATSGIFLFATNAYAGTSPVLSCVLSKGGPTARLYRHSKISDSHRYSIQIDKTAKQPVFDSSDDGDRGSTVKTTCAGTGQARALVVQGEFFGSAYPKGFVMVWNPFVKEVARVDFSERSFPAHIYVNPLGTKVVLRNVGNETTSPFIAYTYRSSDRQTEVSPLNELPSKSTDQLDIVVSASRH